MWIQPEPLTEAWLREQSRTLVFGDGQSVELAGSMLAWIGLEYLIDQGHCTLDAVRECAERPGWQPRNAPFARRFWSVVAARVDDSDREHHDYQGYFCA